MMILLPNPTLLSGETSSKPEDTRDTNITTVETPIFSKRSRSVVSTIIPLVLFRSRTDSNIALGQRGRLKSLGE